MHACICGHAKNKYSTLGVPGCLLVDFTCLYKLYRSSVGSQGRIRLVNSPHPFLSSSSVCLSELRDEKVKTIFFLFPCGFIWRRDMIQAKKHLFDM